MGQAASAQVRAASTKESLLLSVGSHILSRQQEYALSLRWSSGVKVSQQCCTGRRHICCTRHLKNKRRCARGEFFLSCVRNEKFLYGVLSPFSRVSSAFTGWAAPDLCFDSSKKQHIGTFSGCGCNLFISPLLSQFLFGQSGKLFENWSHNCIGHHLLKTLHFTIKST